MINPIPIYLAHKYAKDAGESIERAVNYLSKGDNGAAIRELDCIGARSKPAYGHEIISAIVFYLKGLAESNMGNKDSAIFYLDIVDGISSTFVFKGRRTLLEIKEDARKLKFQL